MNAALATSTLQVRKAALSQTRWHTGAPVPLAPGQVRLGIESFAFTANNVTYAAFGDAMHYWQFFPTGDEAWGCIPVWGFSVVTESLCEGLAVGEKFYGYYPMGSELVMQPVRVTPAGFFDGAVHRQALPVVYNQYMRCSTDPFYDAATEDVQSLLRPLFITSFLIDDFLADNDFFGGGTTLLLSSASSKTAYGTAFPLARRKGLEVVGLTSPGNTAFCEGLGCYSRVLAYDALDSIAADTPCIYVDFAGSAALRQRIHGRFGQLRYNCSIGGTHVDELAAKGGSRDLPGPRPVLFFAPAQVKKRVADWGAEAFGRQLAQAWQNFTRKVTGAEPPWLIPERHAGRAPLEAVYREVLAGKGDPRTGHILQP
ncbi:DUF2855 family protein [Polaromonas sp. YR568]|uniref:DUF2855 family protein n=1 Tax=Polaromonas sp. YR568 TaxID=1855301 RepID=UPI00398C02DE